MSWQVTFLNFFPHPESRNPTNMPMNHEEITAGPRLSDWVALGHRKVCGQLSLLGEWPEKSRVWWCTAEKAGKHLPRERMSLYNLLSTYHPIKWGWIKKENESGMIIAQLVLQQCSPEMAGTGTLRLFTRCRILNLFTKFQGGGWNTCRFLLGSNQSRGPDHASLGLP